MVEWKRAKNGLSVPLVEGKALSSLVDPTREANAWASNIAKSLSEKTEQVFVLGVGGNYHIEELRRKINIEIICIDDCSSDDTFNFSSIKGSTSWITVSG